MTSQPDIGIPASRVFGTDWFPKQYFEPPNDLTRLFDEILITSYTGPDYFDMSEGIKLELTVPEEVIFDLPGFGGVKVVVGGEPRTTLTVGLDADHEAGNYEVSLAGSLSIRFPRDWLRPVKRNSETWVDDPTREYAEVDIGAGIKINQDLNVSFDSKNEFKIEPAMIADSGFVVEGTVSLDLSQNELIDASQNLKLPGGQPVPKSWQGVVFTDTKLHFPDSMDVPIENIGLENFHIGSGGITGSVELKGKMPAPGASDAYTLFGMPYQITKLDVQFIQTSLASASIQAKMQLPFFDEVVGLDLGITMDGGVTATLSSAEEELKKVDKGHFELELERLGFELEDESPAILVGGTITPKAQNVSLPGIDVDELRIDADGDVQVKGGWLDLGDQYKGTVAGFGFEVTKFGLGKTEEGGKWIGFSGSVHLLDGLPAGVSVEGLRFEWHNSSTSVSLDGVGVEFEVPDTLKFKGEVSFKTDEFRGNIDLELLALDLTIDAEVVFGTTTRDGKTFDYMGVALDANLPAGIPLWATGLSLYGVGGLFTNKMEPNKKEGQQWFMVSGKPAESWYHEPPEGVTNLKKWRPASDAMGFGASVALATMTDNGLTVATDLALVMSFPGPVIMLQGRAELLEQGTRIEGDAPFQALMVLDTRAGSTLLGIDAHYEKNPLLELAASAEAFYSFSDPRAWYLNLGRKDPREDRLRADALWIFTAEAYFMLNNDRLAMGIWTGYDRSWKFGPLKVALASWVSSDVLLNFQPAHFYGNIRYHGHASLSIFGFGLDASIDAYAEADIFNPTHILGKFRVSINLPWPLPDPSATIKLEWGPELDMPEIPKPLSDLRPEIEERQEVGIGHEKLSSTWDAKSSGSQEKPSRGQLERVTTPPSNERPHVPMDARPELTFTRPVHDESGVTKNSNHPAPPKEIIGDPAKNEGPVKVRYELSEVNLLAWDSTTGQWEEAGDIDGTWAPVPAGGSGDTAGGAAKPMTQTKLQLSTRTPYHYSRRTGGAWEDAIDRHYPQFPCPVEHYCYDFDALDINDFDADSVVIDQVDYHQYQRTNHHQNPWAQFFVRDEDELTPTVSVGPSGNERAFIVEQVEEMGTEYPHHLKITLPERLRSVKLRFRAHQQSTSGEVRAYDTNNPTPSTDSWSMKSGQEETFVFTRGDAEYSHFELDFNGSIAIVEVCSGDVDLSTPVDFEVGVEEIHSQLARWSDEGMVFEPYTDYRLEIITKTEATGQGDFSGYEKTTFHADYADFRTGGPPGLSTPDLPASTEKPQPAGETIDRTETGLETLARYVHQTDPPTVPTEGEQPMLPKPVYRAARAAVDFNTDYVDLLYRLANRDLAIYLYDANDEPIRDVSGRLVVEDNQWGVTESLILDRATQRWFARLDASPCIDLNEFEIERTKRLETSTDRVLEPDAVHEARLRPLLYRETWEDGDEGWIPVHEGFTEDEEFPAAFGNWEIDGHEGMTGTDATRIAESRIHFVDGGFISQLDAHRDTITFYWADHSETFTIVSTEQANDEVTLDRDPGSVSGTSYEILPRYDLLQTNVAGTVDGDYGTFFAFSENPDLPAEDNDQPVNWSDIRVRAVMGTESNAPSVVGLVFYREEESYYRVELDGNDNCRLVRVEDGEIADTWRANGGYTPGVDTTLTIEAVGDDIQILVDDDPVLRVTDSKGPNAGSVGPYCRGTDGFRCHHVRIDDFRDAAPVAYRYSFTTSKFVDAYHQMHSYDDCVWTAPLPAEALPDSTERGGPTTVPTPAEHRAYLELATGLDGVTELPDQVEVSRLVDGDTTTGLLVQSPEPLDWTTTSVFLEHGPRFDMVPSPPETLKLTDFDFDAQSLSLLLRETADIDEYRIEYRRSESNTFRPTYTGTSFEKIWESQEGSHSHSNPFGEFDIVGARRDTTWEVENGAATVTSPSAWSAAIVKNTAATKGVLTTTVRIENESRAGLVFRYRSRGDHYQFLVDEDGAQVVRVAENNHITLWSRKVGVDRDGSIELELRFGNGMITGSIDGVAMFEVNDPQPDGLGGFGILGQGEKVSFDGFAMHGQSIESVLRDISFEFAMPRDWTFVNEVPLSNQTPNWTFEDAELRQKNSVSGTSDDEYAAPGTYGVIGDKSWMDYRTTTRLQSDSSGAIGVLIRYQDDNNYYRFSMDADQGYRRLVRKRGGKTELLWEEETGFDVGREYLVTIECIGRRLIGYLDGQKLFDVTDGGIDTGAAGVYCRGNPGARFKSIRVVAPGDTWIPYHTFDEDTTLSAGTRIKLVEAGVGTEVPEPRRERRVRNGSPIRLPEESANLRIRQPDGESGHTRQFRPECAYTPLIETSVVRSADGTGIFIFGQGNIVSGQYRVTVTSDKNGQFDVPVRLDIPWDIRQA